MIKDFNGFEDGSSITADICIVGSGAAGITIAREFIDTRHTVVMLESGGFGSETGLPRHRGNKRRRLRPAAGTSAYRDEILAREQTKEHERDERFVELGQYLCEVRAGQYWRLENLKSFDEFLEKRFPESRRKAYYLLTEFAASALGWDARELRGHANW